MTSFLAAIEALSSGAVEGAFAGSRYGVTVRRSADGRRLWLYGEELGGRGRVSFNLYRLTGDRVLIRPCEMDEAWVIEFVLGFEPDAALGADVVAGDGSPSGSG